MYTCSLAMVLNTLQIDPRRAWKGPWRWFHEQMLDCCLPISRVAEEGILLDQVSLPILGANLLIHLALRCSPLAVKSISGILHTLC
jgi:hypothetical protein